MKQHKISLIALLLTLLILSTGFHQVRADENEYYIKVRKGLTYFQKVYERVQSNYVEEIDPYAFVKTGIEGMLQALDPYTVFIEEDEDVRLKILTTGKYGGVGMEIGIHNNNITVISPLDNSPAQKAGIQAGDIITKINDERVQSSTTERISKLLRGPIGSTVQITILRPGFENEITLIIKRDEIIIDDVTYADFVKPGVAYVRLTSFTDKAAFEMVSAIKVLQQKGVITSFILDLRGNSGGLLESAVDVAGIFLPKGTLVVTTRGFRDGTNEFPTKHDAVLPDVPMVVMVDEGSASAAEIVAGCLQDLDRAIIVGTRTFGKGLVQRVYNIDKNSSTKIKITTAKYYIPSGRCVQKQDYTKDNIVFVTSAVSDSTTLNKNIPFYTSNKRMVYEDGGITPDRYIEDNAVDYLITELWRQSQAFNFTVQYQKNHPELKTNFQVDDKVFDQFTSYLDDQKFTYQIEGENELKKFITIARNNNFSKEIIQQTETLIAKLNSLKRTNLQNHRPEITRMLLDELAEKYFGTNEKIRYTMVNDQQLHSAIDLVLNNSEYKKILAIK
jgi:carboxyl-terminal processing protease